MCVDPTNCGGYCSECVTELHAEARKLRAENDGFKTAMVVARNLARKGFYAEAHYILDDALRAALQQEGE